MRRSVVLFVFVCCSLTGRASTLPLAHSKNPALLAAAESIPPDSITQQKLDSIAASDRRYENEKLIAAILAFPIPFGITGLHRIYLGTEPYVPVVYFVTLGGAGLLSLGDFIAIVSADKETFESYKNNPNVFMWVK